MINIFNEYDVKIMSKDVYKNEYGEFEEHKNAIDKKINGSLTGESSVIYYFIKERKDGKSKKS